MSVCVVGGGGGVKVNQIEGERERQIDREGKCAELRLIK